MEGTAIVILVTTLGAAAVAVRVAVECKRLGDHAQAILQASAPARMDREGWGR